MTHFAIRWGCAAALLSPLAVHASGFALLEQSASRLGSAFAGTAAAADDATTNFFNPAGLTKLTAAEVIVIASGIGISSQFVNQGSQPALGQPLGGDGGDAGGWNFVPSAYAAAPIGDRAAIGVGLNAPFGLVTDYESGWAGRFQALKSDLKTLNVNPSFAWRLNDRASIGVGVSYQQFEAELTNAVNYSAVVAQGVAQLVALGQIPASAAPGLIAANAGLEGRSRVAGDDDAWSYNVGVLFDLTESTRVGLSYRSGFDYELAGDVTFAAPSASNPVGASIIAAASASTLANGPVRVEVELPDIATLSLQQQIGSTFKLYADIARTGWSSIQELRVERITGETVSVTPERWEDAWRFALGGEYSLSDRLTLRAGVAYDESAVPDATRTPRLPDTNRTWLAIGGRWRPNDSLVIDAGYAHLFSDDVPLNTDAEQPAAYGALIGEQESGIDIVSVQAGYRF